MRCHATVAVLVAWAVSLSCSTVEAHHDRSPIVQGAIYPQVSPDGHSVVFAHQGAIWRIARNGGKMRRLTSRQGYDAWPAFSPDGIKIAYVSGRRAPSGPVHLIHAETGKALLLPRRPIAKHKIQFTPDGKRLFGLLHDDGRFGLRWFDFSTGKVTSPLVDDQRGLRYALSHDGESVAFSTTQDVGGEQGGNNGPQCDIWIIPSAGGERRKVVRFPGRVYDLHWNPDGKSLFVVSNVGGAHNDLWRVPLENSLRDARKLTFGQADEDAPTVAADGNWLVYTDNRRGLTALVARDLKTDRESRISTTGRDYGVPTGRLLLEVLDATDGKRTTARVSVRDAQGKYHAPAGAVYRMVPSGELHFYCQGSTSWDLPKGEYLIRVARGPEYRTTRQRVTVEAGGMQRETIKVERWTHQRNKGWYSGESHIHANYGYGEWYNSPMTMLAQSAGEDLIVSNLVVANSEADGVFDREYFRGKPDPLSTANTILYWNQEFRSTIWGHLTLLNLKQLVEPIFTGFAHTTNPHDHPSNADIADHVHDQNGHVNYTHPATNIKDPYLSAYSAKALPLDVALGKVDSIDVMGANHVANMSVWYRLLNCGFRLPAAAGTDCFLNRVRSRLPGQVRVYVQVPGEFTYTKWVKGLKAGRTFVTDAPMFEFSVDDQLAGSEIRTKPSEPLRVRGRVTSQRPLNRVEIVANGKVVHRIDVKSPGLEVTVDQKITLDKSGWVALRAFGPSHPEQTTGSVFGHTGVVYVEVAGRPIDARDDARYFIQWIDRLRTDIRRRNRVPARHQVHIESQIAAARDVFNRILQQ